MGRLRVGTASWTDKTLLESGWYPKDATTPEERLKFYAENFDVVVCGDEVAKPKPDPEPYLRAAELLGVAPQRCLAVEDSPTGALAAERAGVAVLVVPCEVPVPGGPGRVLRGSLVGLTAQDVVGAWTTVGPRPAAPRA